MRKFDTLSVSTIEEIASKLNDTKRKDIKIEWVEKNQNFHPISVLYSYEYEKLNSMKKEEEKDIN